MLRRVRLNFKYILCTVALIAIEIMIAKFASGWVRSYLGDVLVVILLYTAMLSIVDINKRLVLLGTLLFSFAIEFSQYFKLAELLGFEKGSLGYAVLGNTFSGLDLLCYTVGCVIIFYQIDTVKS